MTRKIITLLVILAAHVNVQAQRLQDNASRSTAAHDYAAVDEHLKNGRPASALAEAKKLLKAARTPGERLQALLCVGQAQQEINPDSFFATVRTLDEWHRTATTSAERATTAIVIARLLQMNTWRSQYVWQAAQDISADGLHPSDMRLWSRADYRSAIADYRRAAWSEPFDSLHAAKAKDWKPFVELEREGRDVLASRWWDEDLLHIILAEAPDSVWQRAKAYYATVGCLEPRIEDYIRRCRDSIDVCREGIGMFNGEKRVALLQNEQMRIECPQLDMKGQAAFYPSHEYRFRLECKNVCRYTIQTLRLSAEPKNWELQDVRSVGKAVGKTITQDVDTTSHVLQPYTTPAQPGLYALVVTPVPARDVKKTEPIVMPMRVSRYQLLHFMQPDGASRFAVVDAMSGEPVEGVAVSIEHSGKQQWTGKTDRSGRTPQWKTGKRVWGAKASIVGDAQGSLYVNQINPFSTEDKQRTAYSLFSDRSIYRPGQDVRIGVVAYEAGAKAAQVMAGKEVVVTLGNPKREILATDTVATDAMGTATVTFAIPADAEPGVWTVSASSGMTSFRVEEYKRPTFGIELEQVDTPLVVRLTAKSFAGVPMRAARVVGRYSISQPLWWRICMPGESMAVGETPIDTMATDAQGEALIRLPLPETKIRFAAITLTVDVTSASGETHTEELRLPLRGDELAIQARVPSLVERSRITPWDVYLADATGRRVEGEITCHVGAAGKDAAVAFPLGEMPQRLSKMPTGRYSVAFRHGDICSDETYTFTLFSAEDSFTPDTAHFYASADTLPCRLHIGSCLDSVTLFVNAYDGTETLWDKQLLLNKEARTLELPCATHSDGLSVSVVFVKDEHVYTWTRTFSNPRPDTRLRWQWNTFRDRTTPGSHETWSGTLLRPDGSPAPANVMLTLYDASLDAIAPHSWSLLFQPSMQISRCSWDRLTRDRMFSLGARFTLPLLREPELLTHHFSTRYMDGATLLGKPRYAQQPMMMTAAAAPNPTRGMGMKETAVEEECATDYADMLDEADGGEQKAADRQLRQDFSEQAMFMPSLRTDSLGRFTIDFTLPESVTTWQLLGVAHTADMTAATTRQQCIAQKDVMVQLGVPRFLRLGDEGSVTASVTNLTSQPIAPQLEITLSNGDAVAVNLSIAANSDTTVVMSVPATVLDDITVRATVAAGSHSDGELRAIRVIDSRTWVTESIDLGLSASAEKAFDIATANTGNEAEAKLSFNPAPVWTAISALPEMMNPDERDAISLANAVFATTLTHHLATTIPQVQEHRHFPLDSLETAAGAWHQTLEQLQKDDGSFSWFPGGRGSSFITAEVAVELARLKMLTGQLSPLLDKAMPYLSDKVDKEIEEMKKRNIKTVSDLCFYYLYASALMDREARQATYLLPLIARDLTRYSINSRAIAAVIMKCNGKKKEAKRFITSLNEHIVTTADRGAYFDYPGGSFTSINRKLQTLTTAIEAKAMLGDTLHLAGLRRNLLQQRRVQGWDNKLFATAAVSALLQQDGMVLDATPEYGIVADTRRFTITTDTIIALPEVPRHVRLSAVNIQSPKLSEAWGALFIRRLMDNDSVAQTATSISLRRDMPAEACVGDRLTQRYVITVDRDYEWVRLSVPRPAVLEPVEQLSGYRHQNGLSYYLSQHDDREDLFFEQIPRGTYIIESQSFADRPGIYTTGIATMECVYASEFRANAANKKLTVSGMR